MKKKKKKKQQKNPAPRQVEKLAPERPEARDEGPRLIPFDQQRGHQPQFGRRALELADIALGHVTPKRTPKKK